MTRLGHSVPKINPWALRPTLGGPLVALNGGTAGSTELGNDGVGDLGRSVAGHDQPQHRVAGECHRTEGGRVVTLPEAERSFYFAALAQLEPARRPVFTERVRSSELRPR